MREGGKVLGLCCRRDFCGGLDAAGNVGTSRNVETSRKREGWAETGGTGGAASEAAMGSSFLSGLGPRDPEQNLTWFTQLGQRGGRQLGALGSERHYHMRRQSPPPSAALARGPGI